MLFEHILSVDKAKCIELSECYENSEESIASMEHYLEKYCEMLELLKATKTPCVKKQPLFEWHDRNSSSWIFELYRIKHTLHKMLMAKAKEHFDECEYKKSHQLLTRAVVLCKEMLGTEFVKTPFVRGMPELQKEFALALLFRTKGTYAFNLHMQKTTPAVAEMAYKFVELSNAVWKRGANKSYENKLKAHYHFAVASTADDPQVALNHSTLAVGLHEDSNFQELHDGILQKNEQIHFLTAEDVPGSLYTVSNALSKC